jgi:5-methylcytosine-specific restriction enzyme B
VRNIPTLRLSYSNLVLKELEERGPATIHEVLDIPNVEALFKSDRQHPNPLGRTQELLRYATQIGLIKNIDGTFSLTNVGRRYAAAIRPDDPWSTNAEQRSILCELLAAGEDGLTQDVILALDVQRELNELGAPGSDEEFGRLLARVSNTEQWREARTFMSQGARYRALLHDAGLLTSGNQLTSEATDLLDRALVPPHPRVRELMERLDRPTIWWVNQGMTYSKERDGGFIWAPLRNKAGRPQSHWDAMDRVQRGDVILHYSSGFLRSVSTAEDAAHPAPNPLDTDAWERDGRLISTHYHDLNDPVALAAIPENLRIESGGPFTSVGSVQQGYLFPVNEKLAYELADRFPELRELLVGHEHTVGPAPAAAMATPADLHESFAAAIQAAGLVFPQAGNIVRSFVSSLLAKPFAILTGLSGSGKTQLAMRLGEWFGQDATGRPRHLVVPVRPDWTGPEALFGYEDALRSAEARQPIWFVPDPLEFILRAAADPTYPYLLILDEMNLAHVERYFADFLSGIESRKPLLPDLTQDDGSAEWGIRSASATKLPLPRNLFVVGTVNVDETTYMFSPKVLDRASTFEFRVDAMMLDPDLGRPSSAPVASTVIHRGFCDLALDDEWHRQNPHPDQATIVESLRDLHTILATESLEFGHRTFYESLRFAAFYAATGDLDLDHVLDLLAMQKLLPKVHGSRRRIEPVLVKLLAFARGDESDEPRLPATHRKLARMLDAVRASQFVSFTE